MGTRADFYSGGIDPETMVWLGSIAWDGYPEGLPSVLLRTPADEETWVTYVAAFLDDREDATQPSQGWPWPWDDSATTDYAYTWGDDGADQGVLVSNFGKPWVAAYSDGEETLGAAQFPNMKDRQNIAWDKRSGLIIFEVRGTDDSNAG